MSVFLVYGLFGFRGMDVVVAVGVYGKNYALELPRCDQLETERSLLKKRFVSLLLSNQKLEKLQFEERLELYTPTNMPLHYTHINIRKYLGIQVERKVGRSKNKLNKT